MSSGTHIYEQLLKDAAKIVCSLYCSRKYYSQDLFYKSQIRKKWSIDVIYGLEQYNPGQISKVITWPLSVKNYFPLYNLSPTDQTLLASHYLITIFMADV